MATKKNPVIITPDDCRAFWAYTAKKEGFEVIEKATAEEMQAIAWALKSFGGDKNWMTRYTLTLGNRVYVPFRIGSGSNMSRIHQVCTCPHEGQHVRQYRRNPPVFAVNYVFNDAARTHYEADAYAVTMEMYFYLTGQVLAPGTLANKLKGYYVDKADIYVCKKHLTARAALVRHGVITSGISKQSIRWWNRRLRDKGPTPAKVYL